MCSVHISCKCQVISSNAAVAVLSSYMLSFVYINGSVKRINTYHPLIKCYTRDIFPKHKKYLFVMHMCRVTENCL